MRQVLLTSLYDNTNYGNRLQQIALYKTIENIGYYPTVLLVSQEHISIKAYISILIKTIMTKLGSSRYYAYAYRKKRIDLFKQDTSEVIKETINCNNYDKGIHVLKNSGFDAYVTGSDQIWHNWNPDQKELPFFYLDGVPFNKRISYAASFGFNEFPISDIDIHKKYLTEMRNISVREDNMISLIKELTNKKAQKVLDPTLLLTKEMWETIYKKPSYVIPENMAVVFFLGEIDSDRQEAINKIIRRGHYNVVQLNDGKALDYFLTSPLQFIYLISKAEIVLTDSFHATVFSLIFHRNFIVFNRKQIGFENMFERIYTLLTMVDLDDHIFNSKDIPCKPNYDKVDEIIDYKRQESINWLKKAIDG